MKEKPLNRFPLEQFFALRELPPQSPFPDEGANLERWLYLTYELEGRPDQVVFLALPRMPSPAGAACLFRTLLNDSVLILEPESAWLGADFDDEGRAEWKVVRAPYSWVAAYEKDESGLFARNMPQVGRNTLLLNKALRVYGGECPAAGVFEGW